MSRRRAERADQGPLRRLIPTIGGAVVLLIGKYGLFQGEGLIAILTVLMGAGAIIGVVYSKISSAQTVASATPENRMVFLMSLGWLAIGTITILVGVAAGGVLLAVCILGFALSMYLCIGMFISAVRRR